MAETIIAGHKPNTYKAYKTIGGWGITFLDGQGNTRNADGGKIYPNRQNAYAAVKRLNHPLVRAMKKWSQAEAYHDGYTLVVSREDEGYCLSIQSGGMPPHYSEDFKTVEKVEEEIRDRSAFPLYLDWRKSEE